MAWSLQFFGCLRTLSLKFQKARAKIEVYLSLPCWLSQLNFRPHATVIWNLVKPLVLILSRDGSSFNMWIDAFKGWASLYYVLQLMISRGGPSLLCEFMLSRSGPSFTMSIDAFKGWASLYYVLQLMISWDGHIFICQLMLSRGGRVSPL